MKVTRMIQDDHFGKGLVPSAWVLASLSKWIDGSIDNVRRDQEAQTWGRLAKLSEECGEVIGAFIGMTGQNPRKGYSHTRMDVLKELLDVAVTALCAYEHMTENEGNSLEALYEAIQANARRAHESETGYQYPTYE